MIVYLSQLIYFLNILPLTFIVYDLGATQSRTVPFTDHCFILASCIATLLPVTKSSSFVICNFISYGNFSRIIFVKIPLMHLRSGLMNFG